MAAAQAAIDWRQEWFNIEDAKYLNTAAHAAFQTRRLWAWWEDHNAE